MKKQQVDRLFELSQAHATLLEHLRDLEKAVDPTHDHSVADVAAQLDAVIVEIREHFRAEEHGGLLDRLPKAEPRFGHTVRRLIAEHRSLAESLDALIEIAATIDRLTPEFREKVFSWIHRVRRHEIDEDDLILEAYSRDLGNAD
jgi:hypothetical protein